MIETERLYLEPLHEGHYRRLNDLITASYEQLKNWLYWLDHIPSPEETKNFCMMSYQSYLNKENMQLIILRKEDNKIIGCIGVHNFKYLDQDNCFDIGYWISSSYSKNGYMLEALRKLVSYCFDGLGASKLYITTDVKNIRSNNLAIKAGFKLSHTIKKHMLKPDGKHRDTNFYTFS